MIRVAVVDDSAGAKQGMADFLQKYQEKHGVQFQTSFFEDGADFVENYQPVYDLIFLDVEMPKKDGMTAAREIRMVDPDVTMVFITRVVQYAIKGYEVRAMDFLVKPVNYAAFELRMDSLLSHLRRPEEKFLLITTKESVCKIPVSRLIYVEVIKHKIIYHTEMGDYETSETLKGVEEKLENEPFKRCDNCFLVNLKFVTKVGQKELTAGGQQLKISRPRRKEFLEALSDYIGGTS